MPFATLDVALQFKPEDPEFQHLPSERREFIPLVTQYHPTRQLLHIQNDAWQRLNELIPDEFTRAQKYFEVLKAIRAKLAELICDNVSVENTAFIESNVCDGVNRVSDAARMALNTAIDPIQVEANRRRIAGEDDVEAL